MATWDSVNPTSASLGSMVKAAAEMFLFAALLAAILLGALLVGDWRRDRNCRANPYPAATVAACLNGPAE